MGLLDWFKRKPQPPAPVASKAGWIRDQIVTHAKNGDALALADGCASLGRAGSMVFGMVTGDLPERVALREEALEGLRAVLPNIPDNRCEATFEIVTREGLPVDLESRRMQWVAARQKAAERASDEIRKTLASCPIGTLIEACAALQSFGRKVAGVDFGGTNEQRLALLEPALGRLRGLLQALSDDECDDIFAAIRHARLPIDVSARSTEMAGRRRIEQERAIRHAGAEPRNEDLLHAIAANTEDPDTYSVLADWLQQQGHPRGELIALQLRAESEPSLQPTVEAHLMEHTASLLGPLLLHRLTHDGTEREAFTWRRGFIDHARLSYDENAENRPVSLTEILGLLLAHPSGRLLTGMDVGFNGANDASLDDVLETLGARAPTTLRSLLLGDFTQEQSEVSDFDVGDVAPLWRTLSGLRKLVVHGGSFELGTIAHEMLEHAEFKTGGLSVANAQAIAKAHWPRLRHLDVWYGDSNYGAGATIEEVSALLARGDLTALVHLGLMNAAFTDEICAALPGSALAPQLRALDMSLGTMSDEGALALAKAGAFPKLTRLNVSSNYLSDDAIAALKEVVPEVEAEDQRDPADDRYPSLGE